MVQKEYEKLSEELFSSFRKNFGKRMKFFGITGSCATDNFIDGWSDLDILVVIDTDQKSYLHFYPRLKSKIKYGVTMYTPREFQNLQVDGKTLHHLKMIEIGLIRPMFSEIKLPKINSQELNFLDMHKIPERITKLKRRVLINDLPQRETYKEIIDIMKFTSFQKKRNMPNYEEILTEFYNKFPESPKIPSIAELRDDQTSEKLRNFCINFLDFAEKLFEKMRKYNDN